MAINNITGPPVEGDDFFGRKKELDFAWDHIRKGNSMILSAPRRVGKSSFAKRILGTAKETKWNTLEINLEEIKSEEGFVKLFLEKLQNENWWQKTLAKTEDKINQILDSIKPSIELGEAKASIEWKSQKTDVYEKLKSLLNHKEETLIMVDEVTVLLDCFVKNDTENGVNDVKFFLNWLRSFRQVTGTKIRWIFCSSIGIDNFTSLHNLSYTLNDVDSMPIGEYIPEQAKEFIKELASSEDIRFSDDQVEYILNKLGWNLPYFIQVYFSSINQQIKIYDKPINIQTFDLAYNNLINKKDLNTWDERLKEYNEYEQFARLVLKNLSKITEGESRDNLFNMLKIKIQDEEKAETVLNKLLNMLKNDGYIMYNLEAKYTFRSPLLRDFWFNRFAK
jgi:hypothetical protein